MSSLQHAQSPEQADVNLPLNQDVILDEAIEQAAQLLFAFKYPSMSFDNTLCEDERQECRAIARRVRALDRWTLGDAAERLGAESLRLLFGDRRIGPTIRKEVDDFSASYISDLAITFRNRCFFPREVDANQREIEQEDANGTA